MIDMVNSGNQGALLNQKQLAELLKVSAPYLSRLTKEGRIAFADPLLKLYDVDAVRAQLARARDVRQVVATETRRQMRDVEGVPPASGAAEEKPPADLDDDEDEPVYGVDYHENYKIAASFEKRDAARITRIERQQLERSVGLVADMEREAYTEARIVRDTLLGALPAKLAPVLAPITDAFELEQCLREALRAALHDIVRKVEAAHGPG